MYIAIWIQTMDKAYSIAEARHDLASLVHEAETGKAVTLTRRGKPVAVLLSHGQYEQLVEKKRGYWSALRELQKAYDLSGSGLAEAEFEDLRDRGSARRFSW
jgi:prevent-host-death family protein